MEYLDNGPTAAALYARLNAQAKLKRIESLVVFRGAIKGRDAGDNIAQALQRLPIVDADDVKAAVQLLQTAKLCTPHSAKATRICGPSNSPA